jgi:catechol 2,3-dioxygenase-like lactoylglutathione lyase family enzyme
MNGRAIGIGLLAFSAVFGAGLWYAQTRAFYDRVDGLTEIGTAAGPVPVTGYAGLDSVSSPLKLRGCFRADPAAFAAFKPATDATPLVAPGWFDCFDAGALTADLASGAATAVALAVDDPKGFDRIAAIYPDGRGFLWRQLNATYKK